MKAIAIGLLGAGNVGGGVVRILEQNRESIERRLGASVRVKRVLVRDVTRARDVDVPAELLTTDAEQVLADPDVRVVVELIGGIDPARSYVLDAIRRGKHVVTANKALLGMHGDEIFGEATRCGVSVFFEASVAGGIPILRSLREGLASDEIQTLWGIVNGTTNYILDAMARGGSTYDDALLAAQEAGYAEADPRSDVEGIDAAQKLALLALVSFGIRIDPSAIPTEGITRIRPFEHQMARELGYVVKSVAMARADADGLTLAVFPAMVPRGNLLADVRGSYNALLVESRALGRSLYYGRGAGMMPTGTAVVSDIIEVCRGLQSFAEGRPPPQAFARVEEGTPKPLDSERTENYLCVHVPNVPGVLGRVASCLGEHGVSIQRMNQDTPGENEPVDMVILTEPVEEAKLQSALRALDDFEDVLAPTHRIRILPPDPLD